MTRVSDARETRFSFATAQGKARLRPVRQGPEGPVRRAASGAAGTSRGLPVVRRVRGRQEPRRVRAEAGQGHRRQARRHRGRHRAGSALRPEEVRHPVPAGLPARPRRRRRRVRDGCPVVAADGGLRQHVAAAHQAFDQIGVSGWIMCHLSHSYHSGACLYFTFAFGTTGTTRWPQYDVVKSAIQQSFVDHGGTLSHHHAVGTEHSAGWSRTSPSRAWDDRRAVHRHRPGPQLQPGQDHRQVARTPVVLTARCTDVLAFSATSPERGLVEYG